MISYLLKIINITENSNVLLPNKGDRGHAKLDLLIA